MTAFKPLALSAAVAACIITAPLAAQRSNAEPERPNFFTNLQ